MDQLANRAGVETFMPLLMKNEGGDHGKGADAKFAVQVTVLTEEVGHAQSKDKDGKHGVDFTPTGLMT